MNKDSIPPIFHEKFPLFYQYKVSLSELANICNMTEKDTFECIKIVGIIDKVEIPDDQKKDLSNKINNAKPVFDKEIITYEDYDENRKIFRELLDTTDKMVRDICKVHENVRSQLDINKKYKDHGEVILDNEAEMIIKKAFKLMEYRHKKLQG